MVRMHGGRKENAKRKKRLRKRRHARRNKTKNNKSKRAMIDVLSFFSEDATTYAANGIVMYDFDDARKDEFVQHVKEFYRQAFISDKDLQDNIDGLGTSREEEIEAVLPTDPNIKSGDFGEILSYAIFKQLHPEYNLTPLRWRWKEERDRAVHFADIMFLCCPDHLNPQITDKLMTIEVKTRATKPGKNESSIENAIKGALNDSISRGGKTLLFLQQHLKNEKNYEAVKIVKRFENSVPTSYEEYHNAIAIVDRSFLLTHHIPNIDNNNIQQVAAYNAKGTSLNKRMDVFVAPLNDLKNLYENLYLKIKKS